MKKTVLIWALLCLPVVLHAQLFGTITDAPQHGLYGGIGVGPTTKDFSGAFGFAEKLPSMTATYSYSGVTVIPAFITNANGSKSLTMATMAHTGVSQILYQRNRFIASVDLGGGVTMPSNQAPAFNFAALGAFNLGWRLNKSYDGSSGGTNNYLAIRPQFTQLTGDRGGTVVSLGIGFFHGINGQ